MQTSTQFLAVPFDHIRKLEEHYKQKEIKMTLIDFQSIKNQNFLEFFKKSLNKICMFLKIIKILN